MRPLLTLCLLASLLASCGNLQNLATKARAKRQQKAMEKLAATASDEATSRLGSKAIGEVAWVDTAEHFILIRTLEGLNLPAGAALESRREGLRTSILHATAERKNLFLAADVVEGNPQQGDPVYPSTAKPSIPPRPAILSASGSTGAPEPAAASPAASTPVPDLPPSANQLPEIPAAYGFDPANLPPLPAPVTKPEDMLRR